MALVEACACARTTFRVVVVVLIGSALVGLCLPGHVVVAQREYSQSLVQAHGDEIIYSREVATTTGSEISGFDDNSVRSTDVDAGVDVQVSVQGNEIAGFDDETSSSPIRSTDVEVGVSVRSVALKHVVARGPELEDSNTGLPGISNTGLQGNSSSSRHVWRVPEVADHVRIGKRMMVPSTRGRSVRMTKRPTYPCTLPPGGACQAEQTCCGSACVSVSTNPSHCGRCGHMCSAKRVCCSGKCRRLATDEKNCGRCGARCAPGVQCLFGLCGY